MPKWTDYTTKTTVADNDEIMTLDTAGKANKRLSLSTLSDWVLGKIADKVFEKLQTNDKTILGAINELNSNVGLSFTTLPDQNTIVINVIPGAYKGGVYLLFGRSNPNNIIFAIILCFRNLKNEKIHTEILSLDGTTYKTTSDNEKVEITGERITAYSRFTILFSDKSNETSIQIK